MRASFDRTPPPRGARWAGGRPRYRRLGAAALCAIAILESVAAQENPGGFVSVRSRPRPEYEARGVPLGSLRLFPELSIGATQDSNVFATTNDPIEDTYRTLGGSLNLASETGRYPFSLFASASSASYADRPLEDYDDRAVGASISHDFAQRTSVSLSADETTAHESRSDPSFPADAIERPSYERRSAVLDISHAFARGSISFAADLASLDYSDTITASGTVNQDAKDYDLNTFTIEGGVVLSPSAAVFVRATQALQEYDPLVGSATLDRDAATNTLLTGVALNVTNRISGELAVGAFHVDNADPEQDDTRAFTVRSNIEFFVTPLMSASLVLQRGSGAANLAESSTYVVTGGSLGLDYEIRRNLLLMARIDRSRREYSGTELVEDIESAQLSARWLLNRHMNFDVSFTSIDREWPAGFDAAESYDGDVLSVALTLAL